jgi:hypothetical protein
VAPTTARRQERGGGRHRQALGGREAYYTRELATDHEEYLSGHSESPGRWCGAGARLAWTRTLPWPVAATLCVGTPGGVLARLLAPRLSLVLGTVAAGWVLRFRPSPYAVTWRRERRGSGVPPGCSTRWSGTGGSSCTTWPSWQPRQHRSPDDWARWGVRGRLQALSEVASSSMGLGGCGMAAFRSPPCCALWTSRLTGPPRSWSTLTWWWCRSWPSTTPRFPGQGGHERGAGGGGQVPAKHAPRPSGDAGA